MPAQRGGAGDDSCSSTKHKAAVVEALKGLQGAINAKDAIKSVAVAAVVDTVLTVTIKGVGLGLVLDLTKVAPCDEIILEMLLVYYVMQLSYVAQLEEKDRTDAIINQVNDRIKDKVDAFSVVDASASAAP